MSIFWHSVETVLVLFLMGTAGYWLAKKGILDSETRHKLSQALMTIFLPALVIAQLLPAASQSDWKALWVLPLLGFLNIVFGLILGALHLEEEGHAEGGNEQYENNQYDGHNA